ncbi:MAG: hypothetical protein H3C26_10750 [Rhodocyclaceae bacterium]|nr:hypothetical protein [Rhodocyclaceae bacterium]
MTWFLLVYASDQLFLLRAGPGLTQGFRAIRAGLTQPPWFISSSVNLEATQPKLFEIGHGGIEGGEQADLAARARQSTLDNAITDDNAEAATLPDQARTAHTAGFRKLLECLMANGFQRWPRHRKLLSFKLGE